MTTTPVPTPASITGRIVGKFQAVANRTIHTVTVTATSRGVRRRAAPWATTHARSLLIVAGVRIPDVLFGGSRPSTARRDTETSTAVMMMGRSAKVAATIMA